MDITIKTIPHADHRYPTCGDWWFDDAGNLEIRVSDMGDWKKELLVARHEVDEAVLCRAHGVDQKAVDAFDMSEEGQASEEAGEERTAPYHLEHMTAYAAELALMIPLGVDFNDYNEAINKLFE
jgi:hypothetical protein